MSSSRRGGGAQIEVLTEEEYDAEVQREREEQSRRREEERKNKMRSRERGAPTPALATPACTAAPAAAAAPSPLSPWHSCLQALVLPPLFSHLHDTQLYDPASYHRQLQEDVPAFHRRAAAALQELQQRLDELSPSGSAPPSRSTLAPLRPLLTPLLCACIRFLLPPLPPAPTPLVSTDALDSDVAASPLFTASSSHPFQFHWQTKEIRQLAWQLLQKMAEAWEEEWKTEGDDNEQGKTDTNGVSSSAASSSSPDAGGLTLSRPLQLFLAHFLPTHILPFLRQEMRSGNGGGGSLAASDADTAAGVTPTWKSPSRFPSPFFLSFLTSHLLPSVLSLHLLDLLPLTLPLVDDHETHWKVAGLLAIQQMARTVPPSRWTQGWGQRVMQLHMVLYPPILLHDYSVLQQLQPLPTATPTDQQATAALQERAAAHSTLLSSLLHELSYLSLSPTLEHLFPTFVYAQSLLPALLYVGPHTLLPSLAQLLPIVLQWCVDFHAPPQLRVRKLGWELLEAMLHLSVLAPRLAHAHMGRLVEVCATAWMQEEERQTKERTQRNERVALSDPQFAERYSSAPTCVRVLHALRRLAPSKFEPIWKELRQMDQLQSLDEALAKEEGGDRGGFV